MGQQTIGRQIEPDTSGSLMTTPHNSWRLVDYGSAGMVSESPVFGPFMVAPDTEFGRLARATLLAPLAMRAFDINQLSSLPGESTIPNLTAFSTAAGNFEQLPFLQFCANRLKATPKALAAFLMAQSITDVTHSQLRHVGDMEVEGLSGSQTFHDGRRAEAYALGGITDAVKKHGFRLRNDSLLMGYKIPPCIESTKPHINADNYQYVLTEMYEWFAGYGDHKDANVRSMAGRVIERIKHLGSFNDAIDIDLSDGHVVFKDVKDALFFQKCQMLASTEDWKDIINRVREHLYIQDAKYMKIARLLPDMHQVDNGITLHPTGYMYYVDSDVVNGQIKADEEDDMFLHATGNLRKSISREERERFVRHKLRRYAEFLLDDDAVDYPNEMLNGNVVKFGLPSSSVEIIDRVDVPPDSILTNSAARLASTELQSAEGVTYILDPLKNRVVRPYVKTLQGKDYIDKIKSRYGIVSATLFEQHQRLQWQQLTVRLVVTREYASVLRRSFEENNVRYEELKKMPRMSKDQLRRMIIRAGLRGEGVAIETGQLVRAS